MSRLVRRKTSAKLDAEISGALFDKMLLDAANAVMAPNPHRARPRGMVYRSGRRPKAANAAAGSIARKR